MRQDMEALQAAVVAQTASLTIKLSPSEEITRLNSELALLRDLLEKAEKRAELAALEREQARKEKDCGRGGGELVYTCICMKSFIKNTHLVS